MAFNEVIKMKCFRINESLGAFLESALKKKHLKHRLTYSKDGPDEDSIDEGLALATQNAMIRALHEAAEYRGRFGWWNKELCSVEYLRALREKALKDEDHVSVINYTAMIAV